MINNTSKWWKILFFGEKLINFTCVAILVVMIGMVFLNVILRYGFNSGISISVELSRLIFIWITYLGSILALANNQHLSINIVYRYLPNIIKVTLARIVLATMLGLSIIFAIGCFYQMQLNWANTAPISGISMAVFYMAGFISAALMSIILLFKCIFTPEALYQSHNFDEAGAA